VETLLLSLIATGIGLIAIDIAVARLASRFPLPFWFDPNITAAFVLKALGLSMLCAVVAGVLPALRATGGMLQPTLQSTAAGRSSLRLGRVAGALIVIEVGLAVVALFVGVMAWRLFSRTLTSIRRLRTQTAISSRRFASPRPPTSTSLARFASPRPSRE
jgi:hypothetical protein